jgi:tetratricopeptide (TPR) repeat protein
MKHGPSLAATLALSAVALMAAPAGAAVDEPAVAAAAAPAPVAPLLPDTALTKTIEQVRKSPIGREPNAANYLDLIGAGKATAAQVNDFAAYLAKRGMPKVAASFQEYAVRLDPTDATLWLNAGTLRRTNGALGQAATAFKNAIAIDPANALAHYNLGAVYDADKNYDAAIEEYRRALVLDPDLADPRKNPQVVNNENLLAVKLQIYRNQAGSLGLPLLQMQKPSPSPKPSPDKP